MPESNSAICTHRFSLAGVLQAVGGFAGWTLTGGHVLEGRLVGLARIFNCVVFHELMDVLDRHPDPRAGPPILIAHVDGRGHDEGAIAQHPELGAFEDAAAVVAE